MHQSNKLIRFRTALVIPLLIVFFSGMLFTSGVAEEKKRPSLFGITLGLGITVGGTIYSTLQYMKAKEAYSRYTGSAFTENTTELRNDVRSHENQMLLAGLIAGLGAVCVVVSF